MITVVVWKWNPTLGYAHGYGAGNVNTMARMVARHYQKPHRFVCVTDNPSGIECETFPLWPDHAVVANPTGGGRPSCYRRLKIFSEECSREFGPRILSLDLDMVITDDITPLIDRPEPFVGLLDPHVHALKPGALNGSMFLFDSEDPSNRAIWTDFDPIRSPALTHKRGERGSDQAWLSHKKRGCPLWTHEDGVLRYGRDILKEPSDTLPPGTRIVNFAGGRKPWHEKVMKRHPWIQKHYK